MVANFRHGSTLFLVFIGAYLFCRGFFLHRNLSQKTSLCSDLQQFHQIESQLQCWSDRRYDRLVVLVIDALKYDFTVYQEDSTAYWANRMPIFEELRSQFPRQTFHARFVADSPTTTLQRLTALLTGSMPTFIDAATNFYQTSINEDNLIRQMKLNNLSVVFMGDDTWMSLLPDSFKRSYPYPSFVVHDLHTVDNGWYQRRNHSLVETNKKSHSVDIDLYSAIPILMSVTLNRLILLTFLLFLKLFFTIFNHSLDLHHILHAVPIYEKSHYFPLPFC